jgi:hypothetical protein
MNPQKYCSNYPKQSVKLIHRFQNKSLIYCCGISNRLAISVSTVLGDGCFTAVWHLKHSRWSCQNWLHWFILRFTLVLRALPQMALHKRVQRSPCVQRETMRSKLVQTSTVGGSTVCGSLFTIIPPLPLVLRCLNLSVEVSLLFFVFIYSHFFRFLPYSIFLSVFTSFFLLPHMPAYSLHSV